MTTPTADNQTLSSDALHNRNCYVYFLQLKPLINSELKKLLPQFAELHRLLKQEYDEHFPYGNLYSSLLTSLEKIIENKESLSSAQTKALDGIIETVYNNNNQILEQEFSGWINCIASQTRPQKPNPSQYIKKNLKDPIQTINYLSPNNTEALISRIFSVFSKNFKPQFGTNIPSVKNYSYKTTADATEFRFSTQAQRHQGATRVSPLFKRWLEINAPKYPEQTIHHIYFNNLAYDAYHFDIARAKERALTQALHDLEHDPKLKIMVITLPANDGLMNSKHYRMTQDKWPYAVVFDELLAVFHGKKHKNNISDLIISPETKKRLFKTSKNEQKILKRLLIQSFKCMGINSQDYLSTAQKQAVYVHFIKYELTNYMINTIKPKSYNFSCKDAIDRGALSSAYYNMMRSFILEHPMQRKEFERALDAAAANVKGRGMNFHRHIIWNALNTYVDANYTQLIADNRKSWLIYWRDMNCPHSRVEQIIHIRLGQCFKLINALPNTPECMKIKNQANHLLSLVKKLNDQNVSGKRLLLEVISRTSELITTPSTEAIENYKKLATELKLSHATLTIIAGVMRMLLGALFIIPSLGYSYQLIQQGYTTSKAGFFSQDRTALSHKMLEFSIESPQLKI
ncbi:hypothetical protein [Legionella drancourtii]|nr:hypothetical protein [Legionella drancourtii]